MKRGQDSATPETSQDPALLRWADAVLADLDFGSALVNREKARERLAWCAEQMRDAGARLERDRIARVMHDADELWRAARRVNR